jgi:hypothetical protein
MGKKPFFRLNLINPLNMNDEKSLLLTKASWNLFLPEVFERPVFTIKDRSEQKTFAQYKAWAEVNKNKEFVNFAKENSSIFPFSILLLQNVFLLYGIPDEHYTFKEGYNSDLPPVRLSVFSWIRTVPQFFFPLFFTLRKSLLKAEWTVPLYSKTTFP